MILIRSPKAARTSGTTCSGDGAGRIAEYAAGKPGGARGGHRYSLEDAALDAAAERQRFGFYPRHYGVREESA